MNEVIKFKGIVLKEMMKGESDKAITVLAKGLGVIRISARGAKNTKSKFLAGAQAFSYCDFVCYAGKNFYSLNEITVIRSFYHLRLDYHKITAAFYFCEMTEKTIFPNEPCDDILLLLIKTFLTLSKPDCSVKQVVAVFVLKFLVLNGFTPALDFCALCGQKTENPFISPLSGGVVCEYHTDTQAIRMEKGTYLAIQYITRSNIQKVYSFAADKHVLDCLWLISRRLLHMHIEIQLHTENFIMLE